MKTKETQEIAPNETALGANPLGVSNKQFLEKFEGISDDNLRESELPVLNFEEGVVHNLLAIDIRTYDFKDGEKEVVIFEDKNGIQSYNGNAYVFNAIKRIPKLPFPVRIVCTGDKQGANGKYKTFSIKTLG